MQLTMVVTGGTTDAAGAVERRTGHRPQIQRADVWDTIVTIEVARWERAAIESILVRWMDEEKRGGPEWGQRVGELVWWNRGRESDHDFYEMLAGV